MGGLDSGGSSPLIYYLLRLDPAHVEADIGGAPGNAFSWALLQGGPPFPGEWSAGP